MRSASGTSSISSRSKHEMLKSVALASVAGSYVGVAIVFSGLKYTSSGIYGM